MIGLYLDPETHDLATTSRGNLRTVESAEAVSQHVKQRLLTHEGEWYLDTSAGVPWLDRILGRQYDPELAEAVVKNEAVETDGVTEIEALAVRFDKTTRGVIVDGFHVQTEFDGLEEVTRAERTGSNCTPVSWDSEEIGFDSETVTMDATEICSPFAASLVSSTSFDSEIVSFDSDQQTFDEDI